MLCLDAPQLETRETETISTKILDPPLCDLNFFVCFRYSALYAAGLVLPSIVVLMTEEVSHL